MIELLYKTTQTPCKDTIIKAANKTLEMENVIGTATIIIVEEDEIKKLNSFYRHKDQVTDVLSFCEEDTLGTIFICLEKAEKQAKEYGNSLERELAFLTIHGMLHLLGYDHIEKTEEEEMIKKQQALLKKMEL